MFGFGKKKEKSNEVETVYCDKLSNDKHSIYFTKVNGKTYVEDINLRREKEEQLDEFTRMKMEYNYKSEKLYKEQQQEINVEYEEEINLGL